MALESWNECGYDRDGGDDHGECWSASTSESDVRESWGRLAYQFILTEVNALRDGARRKKMTGPMTLVLN